MGNMKKEIIGETSGVIFSPKVIGFAVLLSLLLVARDIAGIGINKYLFLALSAVFMFIADYAELSCMICFTVPLMGGLPGTYIRLLALLLLIGKRKLKMRYVTFFFLVFFSALELIASVWYPAADAVEILSYLTCIAILFFLIYEDTAGVDHRACLAYYTLGTLFFCLVVVIGGVMVSGGSWLTMLSNVQFRFGETAEEGMHLQANANALAYYCLAACVTGFCVYRDKRTQKGEKLLFLIVSVLIAVIGFLSLSRSYVLVFALLLLWYAFKSMRSYKAILQTVIVMAVGVVLVVLFVNYTDVGAGIWNGLATRFGRDDVLTGNNRTNLFLEFLEAFVAKIRFWILGTGVTQYRDMLGLPENYSIHNMFEQVFICLGVPGAAVFFTGILSPVWKERRTLRLHREALLPCLAILLFTQTIQFLNPYPYMMHYIIAFYAIKSASDADREGLACDT